MMLTALTLFLLSAEPSAQPAPGLSGASRVLHLRLRSLARGRLARQHALR